jgi:hypothetical protein
MFESSFIDSGNCRILDNQIKLNSEIINIYDSIKEWRSFDNGYTNNQYYFGYDNIDIINEKFRKNISLYLKSENLSKFSDLLQIKIDHLNKIRECLISTISILDDDGDNNYVEYFMHDLGHVLRDYDGHNINDDTLIESDNNEDTEYYEKDYDVIIELKNNIQFDFLKRVLEMLKIENFKNKFCTTYSDMDIDAGTYFFFMYSIILISISKPIIQL